MITGGWITLRSQFIVFLLLFLSTLTSNANAALTYPSMKGIKSVSLYIDSSGVDKRIGISQAKMKAKIEKLFKNSGIQIGAETAELDIDIYTVGIPDQGGLFGYLYGVSVELSEPATLSRIGVAPVAVVTWEETEDGVSSDTRVKKDIQDSLDIAINSFVTTYKNNNLVSTTTPSTPSKSIIAPDTPK